MTMNKKYCSIFRIPDFSISLAAYDPVQRKGSDLCTDCSHACTVAIQAVFIGCSFCASVVCLFCVAILS